MSAYNATTLLDQATERLRAAGIAEPRREARALLRAIGDLSSSDQLQALLDKRAAGVPLSRIVGRREFWSIEFALNAATLDPRPDSETLVEAVLETLPARDRPWRLLDLGTGTGCLLLALLSELPAAWGLGLDLAPAAAAQARQNALTLGLASRAAFLVDDWGRSLAGRFDLAVANPPYIASPILSSLPPEVRGHDPLLALDGGEDGLAAYRRLLPQVRRLLVPGGLAAVEIGYDQEAAVEGLIAAAGLDALCCRRDLGGQPRVWLAQAPGE